MMHLYPGSCPHSWKVALRVCGFFLCTLLLGAGAAQAQKTLTADSLSYTEDFTGFDGSGFTPAPAAGQLNSSNWRISGASDGAGTFGGTHNSGDFARGSSTGGITFGGVYSFDAGGGNTVLGLQPGGSDFTPGDIALRLENQTGAEITEITLRYSIFVFNDQDRGSSFNLAYSTDDATYTAVPSASYTTPQASDETPAWIEVTREITISGLNQAVGDFIYLRWETDDVSGSGSRDEFGLTNIEIETNVTSSPPPTDPLFFSENFDGFTADGFSPTPGAGQLDSNFWRVTGASDGDGTFGGTHVSGDFARGSSTGGVTTGGVYSFDAGNGNTVLGIQPAGSDFTPGEITLRLQNDTGGQIDRFVVRYSIFVYDDQARTSSFNFAYSVDDAGYTPIPSANYTTPGTESGAWIEVERELTIPGVDLADQDYIYLQWQSDDAAGSSGSRPEFGLSKLEVETQDAPTAEVEQLGEFEITYVDNDNNSQSSNTTTGIGFSDVNHTTASEVLLRTGSGFDQPFFQTGSGWSDSMNRAGANYYFFNIEAGEGFRFTPTEISFKARRTGSGPPNIGIEVEDQNSAASHSSSDISLTDGDIISITESISGLEDVSSVQVQIRGWAATGTGPLQISELKVRGTISAPEVYEWVGGNGSFSSPANWLPNRPNSANAGRQLLEFSNGGQNQVSVGITDISSLGGLRVTSGSTVTFVGSSTPDITLTGIGTQPQALFVESGSTLRFTNNFDLRLGSGQDGRVEGTVELATNNDIRILIDDTAGELRFGNGGLLIANGSSAAFGDAVSDSKTEGVIFESGSEFRYQRGRGDPFGSSINPSMVMQPGSMFTVAGTSTFPVNGYTYADITFEENQDRDVAQDGFTADNIIINTPSVGFNIQGDVVIRGNITINAGNTLRFGKAGDAERTPLFRFEGTGGLQRISGDGSFVMQENATMRITNADHLASQMDITLNGTYDPQGGVLFMEDGAQLSTFAPAGVKNSKNAPDLALSGGRGWRMLSAPVTDMLVSDLEAQNHVQGVSGNAFSEGDANLLFRRGTAGNYSWQAPENLSAPLPSGEGFIWFLYDEADFPGGSAPVGSNFQALPFTLTDNGKSTLAPGDADAPLNEGDLNDFSLAGNPYPQPISTEFLIGRNGPLPQAVQVWQSGTSGDGATGSWVPVNTSVSAWQGFVIQGSAAAGGVQADSLIFTNLGKLETGESFKQSGKQDYPALTLELRGHHPETGYRTADRGNVFYFHPYARQGADMRDTPKLQALNAASAQLGIQAMRGGQVQLLSQDARPQELEEDLLIPLELLLNNMAGEFEISWEGLDTLPEHWNVSLVDVEAGQSIDLRNSDSYSFEDFSAGLQNAPEVFELQMPDNEHVIRAQNSTGYARFRVSIRPGTPTSTPPETQLPEQFKLHQNYPNPFNPSTNIRFELPEAADIRLEVFDILGRRVATLLSGQELPAGTHTQVFDAGHLSSGVYLYRLSTGTQVKTQKMTLVK